MSMKKARFYKTKLYNLHIKYKTNRQLSSYASQPIKAPPHVAPLFISFTLIALLHPHHNRQ